MVSTVACYTREFMDIFRRAFTSRLFPAELGAAMGECILYFLSVGIAKLEMAVQTE